MSTTAINPQLEQAAHYREQGWCDDSTLPAFVERWADEDPGHAYLSDGTSTYTYGEFRDAAWNLAAGLLELGAAPGDRVAVQLPNWNEYFLLYAACARIGVVMIPVVPVYREGEVGFFVESSAAVGLVTTGVFRGFDAPATAASIAAIAPSLKFRIVVRGAAGAYA